MGGSCSGPEPWGQKKRKVARSLIASWEISLVLDLPNPAIQLITTGLYFFFNMGKLGLESTAT